MVAEHTNGVFAKHRYVRVSPQKARLVADQVRGKNANAALELLKFSNKKTSRYMYKILHSAMANAENNEGLNSDALYVSAVYVDEGPVLKRGKARAKGRSNRIFKRTSHIVVGVREKS